MKMSRGGPQQGGLKHKVDGVAYKLSDALCDLATPAGEPGYVSGQTDRHYGTGEYAKQAQEADKQATDQHYAEKARQDQEHADKQRAEQQQDAEKAGEAQTQ